MGEIEGGLERMLSRYSYRQCAETLLEHMGV